MYTILIPALGSETEQNLKELFTGTEQLRILSGETDEALHCLISTPKGIYNIPYEDILFVESGQKKSVFHLTRETLSLPVPLYRIREILPNTCFVQTHRSFIVNLHKISYIDKTKDPWTICFFGSEKTAFVSRSYRKDLLRAIRPLLNCSEE